ncbi:hypothetical protein [Telmatospirillum siberiense]|uniref:Uncharacterized protein n=1 Tax=Telmatospirillum siberiense TaxID=382514 RepID=A0A2N3PXD5_9PROT|nr:hypothetical protein [Telmatospirillum siberiense]PKU25048.1 hypothetical protein CWS72_07490 [Telmatospirillum siberiense]
MIARPEPSGAALEIEELGPQKFALAVTFDGQRFDCGTYISRGAAMQAGRLFIDRKEGERASMRKRPRKKGA